MGIKMWGKRREKEKEGKGKGGRGWKNKGKY